MLDGSDYFHATEVQCPACLQRRDGGGQGHCRQTGVSATLVKAGAHRGFPLDVEEVRNSDGQAKQDGELQAAKRLLNRLRQEHPQLALLSGGDALSCHDPFIVPLRQQPLHHVLVWKPDAHREVSTGVAALERLSACERGQWHAGPACRRRFFPYRIACAVPLTPSRRVWGTLVEVWEHDQTGKLRYHHAWCTDLAGDATNVAVVVRLGRSRWKIANEQFHVQKNQGDALEHHAGHGHQTLAMVFSRLHLLAFVAHGLLERGEQRSQRCLATTSRRALWHPFRTTMRLILVASWAQLLLIYLDEEGPSP
jgi:hypothetical protein